MGVGGNGRWWFRKGWLEGWIVRGCWLTGGWIVDCPEAEATYVITSGGIRDPDKV